MQLAINWSPLRFFIPLDKGVVMQQIIYISIVAEFHKDRYMI